MTQSTHIDLEAIRAKLRSIRDRQLIEPLPAPPRKPPTTTLYMAEPQVAVSVPSRGSSAAAAAFSDLPESPPQAPPVVDPVPPAPTHPATEAVENLQRRSRNLQPTVSEPRGSVEMPLVPDPVTAAHQRWYQQWQRLQEQVQHINQLALAQETALLDLRATAEAAAHWQRIANRDPNAPQAETDWTAFMRWEEEQVVVPHVDQDAQGRWFITARPVDLFRAQREAEDMAQHLRDRSYQRFHPAQVNAHEWAGAPGPLAVGARWLSNLWNWLMSSDDGPDESLPEAPNSWASSAASPFPDSGRLSKPYTFLMAVGLIAIAVIAIAQFTAIPPDLLRWVFVAMGAIGLLLAFLKQQARESH